MKIHKNKKRKDDVTRETCYQIIVSQNKKFGIYYQIIRKNYILELKKKKKKDTNPRHRYTNQNTNFKFYPINHPPDNLGQLSYHHHP